MTTSRARVAYAELRALSGAMTQPAQNAHSRWSRRDGLLLLLGAADGLVGLGEAAPLPGYSTDDLLACRASLQQVPWHELSFALTQTADRGAADAGPRFAEPTERVLAALPPAARCAAETALLDLASRQRGVSLATLLRGEPPPAAVAVSALLAGGSVDELLASAASAFARGLRVLKLKVGRPGGAASDLLVLRELRRRFGSDVALRLDANRAWTLAQAQQQLAELAVFDPELVEEPLAQVHELHLLRTPLRIALDESLAHLCFDREVLPLLVSGVVQALVLKPMALGGPRRCLQLARRAAAYGVPAVVTHLFDGPVALAAAAALALALPRPLACGLDAHPGLALGPDLALDFVGMPQLTPSAKPGLGGELTTPPRAVPCVWSTHGNDPNVSIPASATDGLSLLAAARQVPAQPALIVAGQVYTCGELAPRVQRLVSWLAAQPLGQAPWPRVALCADNRLETALLIYALFELGMTAVLIHPRLTQSERAALIADCAPALVLDENFIEPTAVPVALLRPAVSTAAPLAILYTSGTTGRQKGVMLSRRAFLAAAAASAQNLGWQADDRWLLCMPLAHVGGLSILVRCLLARRATVLTPGPFDPHALVKALHRDRVTLLSVVPTMLRRLFALSPPWTPPAPLRAVLLGGAAAAEDLLAQAAARGVPVLTTYGLTEACSQVTTQRYGTPPSAEQGAGEPLACLRLRISAPDDQIQIQSPTLFDGYWPPRATPPSALSSDGWLTTGDLGRVDQAGRLHVLARRTDLIISGGENVYPAEVEQALERCPGVAAACVVGLPDAEWGQRVAAALVATAGPLSLAELRAQLHAGLSSYKHPRQLLWLPALPLNATGKLDRSAVTRLFLAAMPVT